MEGLNGHLYHLKQLTSPPTILVCLRVCVRMSVHVYKQRGEREYDSEREKEHLLLVKHYDDCPGMHRDNYKTLCTFRGVFNINLEADMSTNTKRKLKKKRPKWHC